MIIITSPVAIYFSVVMRYYDEIYGVIYEVIYDVIYEVIKIKSRALIEPS